MAESPTGGGLSGYVSGKTSGIELSEGVGKGLNVYDVIVGLRTSPIIEKPLAAAGGTGGEVGEDTGYVDDTRDVDEGTADNGGEDSDGGDREDGTLLLAGGSDEKRVEFWAWTAARKVNKEHRTEKGGASNMVGVGGQPWALARALDVIIYRAQPICLPDGWVSCLLLLGPP